MARAFGKMNDGRATGDYNGISYLRLIGLRSLLNEGMTFDTPPNEQVSELLSESELLREMAANIRLLVQELIERLDAKNALPLGKRSQVGARCICGDGHSDHDQTGLSADRKLPDPRLIRNIIRQRQQRAHYFGGDLFADPAWDMLLDLAAAHVEHQSVSITSLSIASGVPTTTALRWIGLLIEAGLCERIEDNVDRRRAFIVLTDQGVDGIARFFEDLGDDSIYLT